MADQESQRIVLEREGALARLAFQYPERMNAMDVEMCVAFARAIGEVLSDKNIRAVLIHGDGKAFCSGADLREMVSERSERGSIDIDRRLGGHINPALKMMAKSQKPIIAAVNGAAVGVGCGIALASDIVLVGRSGYFLQSFSRLGVIPDGGSTWTIPRLAGLQRAAAMMILAERVDAETAVSWGLAYRLFEDDALLPAALEMARMLAEGPTLAYAEIKRLLRHSLQNDFPAQLQEENRSQQKAFATRDCEEGIAAFVEKRAPDFRGA